jgi:toxin ParE1/3/4
MKVEWSARAQQEVTDIAQHKAQFDSEAAFGWVNRIYDASYEPERFPEMGRMIPELQNPALREIIFEKQYRMMYRVTAETIEILAVRHGRQAFDL